MDLGVHVGKSRSSPTAAPPPPPAPTPVISTIATFIAFPTTIPTMVVTDVTAVAFPSAAEILAAVVVRSGPVRACIRWSRPVPIVPEPAPAHRIPVALNPLIVGAGLRRDAVPPRRGRGVANRDAETHLRTGSRGGRQQQSCDGDCLQKLSHTAHQVQMERQKCERLGCQPMHRIALIAVAVANTMGDECDDTNLA